MDEFAAAANTNEGADNNCCGDNENFVDTPNEASTDRVGVFCCRDCGEGFRDEAAYLKHRRQHPQQHACLGEQSDGLLKKDSETPHICSFCSLSFVNMSELHLHMKNHDQDSSKEPDTLINPGVPKQHQYECPDCGKCYVVIGHFLNHQRSHQQPSKSVFHDLEHLKKKSFQCETCGRNYSRASALDAHRRCHEEKLIKSKTRNSGDMVHTDRRAVEVKPSEGPTETEAEKCHKCLCGKAFSTVLRLKTHQRFSRNSQCSPEEIKQKAKKTSNEFHCSECNKAFNGHIALFNHQRWHANHSDDSAKRFSCEACGKVFMTLTFYYRHQRTAHSDETPAKSFLHQVCQLQKKAFECKDCGLKFSRASALHSHQLQHTDVFRETEKEAQMRSPLLPVSEMPECGWEATQHSGGSTEGQGLTESSLPAAMPEESHISEADEDSESYEPGDFNVQVISASEDEDDADQDLNPDLELLCESDQDVRDDCDAEAAPRSLVLKPEMDLKIVRLDFGHMDEQRALLAWEAEGKADEERHDCPECYRWFPSPSSLHVHRMWHDVHRRRQQTQGQSAVVCKCHKCGHETNSYEAHCSHIQTHSDQSQSDDVLNPRDDLEIKPLVCSDCGNVFSQLSALVSHQLHHSKRKQFQCPDCMVSFLHAASLFNHLKICSAQKKEDISACKKEYNPKKTLLGPKIYHCEHCGKGFWSLGAYSHHKQNQTECVDLRLRKGTPGSLHSVNGRQRSSGKVACPVCGRKFRHKGIMALHMRKHENGNHKCELCSRSFRLFSSLLRHQVVHSDQLLPPPIKSFQHQVEQLKKNTYSCPDCGKLFSRAKALQFHMKSHGYETGHSPSSPRSTAQLEDLQCATCLAHFNSKSSLRAHRKLCIKKENQVAERMEPLENMGLPDQNVHPGSKNDIKSDKLKTEKYLDMGSKENLSSTDLKYKCKKCDRSFSVVGALNFHKRVHAEGNKTSKSNLAISLMFKKPKKEEPSKGPFHCSECGRRFMTNSALGSHKRWHKEKKCSRTSLKEDDLKSEDGPFHCTKCGKQFFNRRVLRRHQIFNLCCQTKSVADSNKSAESNCTSDRFSCPECDETFEQGSFLAFHFQTEHAADRQGHQQLARVPEQVGMSLMGKESLSQTLMPKAHQCPLCSMTFTKARGLRAHKWQAHSKSRKRKNKLLLSPKMEPTDSNNEFKMEDSGWVNNCRGAKRNGLDPLPEKSASLDCADGSVYEMELGYVGVAPNLNRVSSEFGQESKLEIQTHETTAEVPPSLVRLSERAVKCFFKCGKCGKAFQTEEQLGAHKTKAKARPYCCALCCHGFWSETQLQQHLAWHDQVRCRLPNEVRFRLSAAMTSKPQKSLPASPANPPAVSAASQSQSAPKCQHCGRAFLSATALEEHQTQECGSCSLHCAVCLRTFSHFQHLIDHHQECSGDHEKRSQSPAADS
ncbi:uncharacterized protein ACNS7B_019528 [Menidia menidia]